MLQVLQRMTYGDSTLRETLQGQGRVLLFNYWLTYCVLKAKKPRFQPLLPAAEAETAAGTSTGKLLSGPTGGDGGTDAAAGVSEATGGGNGG